FANQYKNTVPDADEVKIAYIGNNSWIYNEIDDHIETETGTYEINDENISEIKEKFNVVLFTEEGNIEKITRIHKEILTDPNYNYGEYYLNDIMIVYYMKDGSRIIRDYNINKDNGTGNKMKDVIATELLNSQEFKINKYYYLYDEKYVKNNDYIITVKLRNDGREIDSEELIDIDKIRPYLIKDIEEDYYNIENSFMALSNYDYEPLRDFKEMGYFLEINIRDYSDSTKDDDGSIKDNYQTIYINDGFDNTREYLKLK
ncbi:MAG: hypothetical protein K0R07_2131, partial [Sedimentibacter sp.]|nr:hypothetical protein [Sedimentibacter sp.]